jgi:hypothetical protein
MVLTQEGSPGRPAILGGRVILGRGLMFANANFSA